MSNAVRHNQTFLSPGAWAMLAVLAAGVAALFFRWFGVQHFQSSHHMQDWGHSYIIPGISAYLVWRKREEIAKLPVKPFWPGLLALLMGVAAYMFFNLGAGALSTHMTRGYALILTVFGLCLFLAGPAVMRHLFLPIAFLAFGVTIAEPIMDALTLQLKLVASQGAWVLLALVGFVAGFDAEVAGNVITVTDAQGKAFPLNVAEQCSGMRMVIAFLALGAAVALISGRSWWQRSALVLLATPVALIVNVVRVAILGILTLIDPNLATGDAHMFIGTLLLVPGLGLFMLCQWALNKVFTEDEPAKGAAA